MVKKSISADKAFPKFDVGERFEYIGCGSYARVYRHHTSMVAINKVSATEHHQQQAQQIIIDRLTNLSSTQQQPLHETSTTNRTSIIKLIDVFAENLLSNLVGVSSKHSVSTYKHAYNEFRISIILSQLNNQYVVEYGNGINLIYQCPLFPDVYECQLINSTLLPAYFQNADNNSTSSNTSKNLVIKSSGELYMRPAHKGIGLHLLCFYSSEL